MAPSALVLPRGHTLPNAIVFLHLPSADRSQRDETDGGVAYLNAYGLGVETDLSLPATRPVGPADHPHARDLARRGSGRAPVAARHATLPAQPPDIRRRRRSPCSRASTGICCSPMAARPCFTCPPTTRRCAMPSGRKPAEPGSACFWTLCLWTVSLLRGFELLHASAVTTDHGLIALVARTGGGKSSLAAEFLRRGAALFSDDIVALDDAGGEVIAHPGPPLMNLPRVLPPAQVGGTVVAEFGDERWVALDRARRRPVSPWPRWCSSIVSPARPHDARSQRRQASPSCRTGCLSPTSPIAPGGNLTSSAR